MIMTTNSTPYTLSQCLLSTRLASVSVTLKCAGRASRLCNWEDKDDKYQLQFWTATMCQERQQAAYTYFLLTTQWTTGYYLHGTSEETEALRCLIRSLRRHVSNGPCWKEDPDLADSTALLFTTLYCQGLARCVDSQRVTRQVIGSQHQDPGLPTSQFRAHPLYRTGKCWWSLIHAWSLVNRTRIIKI